MDITPQKKYVKTSKIEATALSLGATGKTEASTKLRTASFFASSDRSRRSDVSLRTLLRRDDDQSKGRQHNSQILNYHSMKSNAKTAEKGKGAGDKEKDVKSPMPSEDGGRPDARNTRSVILRGDATELAM